MREYVGPPILPTSMMVIGLLIFFLGLAFYYERVLSKAKKTRQAGVEVVCKACNGTGEKEQDVNLLMAEGMFAIWINGHSYGCEECNSGHSCDTSKRKHDEIMVKYEELGPKMDKAACPDCMGAGRYTQYDGYRFGRERE